MATGEPAPGADPLQLVVDYDHGLTHLSCAAMTVKFCPSFRDGMTDVRMVMWTVSTASLREVWSEVDDHTLTLSRLLGVEPFRA